MIVVLKMLKFSILVVVQEEIKILRKRRQASSAASGSPNTHVKSVGVGVVRKFIC